MNPLLYVKQYGLPRSGTNFTRALIEENFSDCRVLQNIFGSKHGEYDVKHFEKNAEYWLTHKNVITDLTSSEIYAAKQQFDSGNGKFVVTIKEPAHWLSSCVSYQIKSGELNSIEQLSDEMFRKHMRRYNRINTHYLEYLEGKATFVYFNSFYFEAEEVLDYIGKNLGVPLSKVKIFLFDKKFQANPDKSSVKELNNENFELQKNIWPELDPVFEKVRHNYEEYLSPKLIRFISEKNKVLQEHIAEADPVAVQCASQSW